MLKSISQSPCFPLIPTEIDSSFTIEFISGSIPAGYNPVKALDCAGLL